jgi:sugar lactone lactonase YvrE
MAQRMPQDSWYLAKEFSAGGVGKFSYPQDVAVGPDGNLYVADSSNSQIQVLDADGLFLRSWNGNSAEVPNNSSFNPRAVAVSSDGKVYVADTNYYNISRILVFDAQGKFLRSMGQQGDADGKLNNPTSIAVDAAGNAYVGDDTSRITVFNANGAYVRHWGGYGEGDDKFYSIAEIQIVAGNKLAVLDGGGQIISVFNADGTFDYNTNYVSGYKMSVDATGNFYLPSWGGMVRKYSSSGALLQEFNFEGKIGSSAYGLAVSGDKIYLADYSNHRINIIDTSGNFIAARGVRGGMNEASAYGLATDSLGNIYLADFDMGEIRKYDANHQLLKKFGTQGSGNGQFSGVRELAIGPNQKLYALDQNNSRVQIFGLEGNFLGKFGSSGSGNGQFSVPYGLAVGNDNKVYVADKDNHRVQIFDANGNFLSKFGKEGSFDGEFKSPMGLSISPDQKLAVADSGNRRIQIFDANGVYLTKYASELNRWGYYDDYFTAERLSYASDGLLFATELGGNRIRVYSPEGANIKEWNCKSCAMAETKSGDLIAAHGDRVVRVWKRTFRTVHPEPSNAIPLPAILSQGRRPGSSLVDVEYRVKDADDATVQTAALAFKNGGNSLSDVIPITSLAEGTGNKLGANIATGQTHRFTWNVAGDWNTDFAEVQLEVLAKDNRGLLNLDFLRIPATVGNPELKISRSPVNDNDFLSVWYWLLATGDPDVRLDNGQVLALNGSTQLEGLIGEYYSEEGFKGNATLRFGEVPNISYYGYGQNQAKSVRWTGQFVPQQTGNYTIKFSQSMISKPNVKFSVNGNEVTMNPDLSDPYFYMPSSSSSFNFSAQSGISVPIKIEYDAVPSYQNFYTNIQKPDSDSTSPSLSDFKNTSTILAMGSTTTKLGRDFIFQRMGLREATAAEVTRAKEAGTPRVINQWEPEFKVGPDERPAKVNAYGFDTGAEGYWAVPVAGN